MFTGIVEETGRIIAFKKTGRFGELVIKADKVLTDTKIGDSIAVNGMCLTVKEIGGGSFSADVMSETVAKTSLSTITAGDRVNLERAMPANGRFGGHIVSGHIDGTGIIESMRKDGNAVWVAVRAPREILDLIVYKGSVTIDGISLTVAYVDNDIFKVSIIPHTWENTALFGKKPGDIVNLENDIVGKYVEKILNAGSGAHPATGSSHGSGDSYRGVEVPESKITAEYLRENGF